MRFEYVIRQSCSNQDALDRFEGVLWSRGLALTSTPTIMWQRNFFTDLPDAIVQAEVVKEKYA